MKEILTERLFLRAWKTSDAKRLYQLAKDPDIGPVAGWQVHTSVANSMAIILTALSGEETYAICLKNEDESCGEIVGSIGIIPCESTDLTKNPKEAEMGFWVGKEYWGKGYVPEAAKKLLAHAKEDLGLTRMWCAYYEGNAKSKRVQEKIGFTYSHSIKDYYVKLLDEIRDLNVNYMDL